MRPGHDVKLATEFAPGASAGALETQGMKMNATSKQIEHFENTVRHAAQNPTCVYAANNVMRMKAKLDAKRVDTQSIFDRYGYAA